jgi:hypothetical protein
MSESKDENEYERDANDLQTFNSLVNKEVVDPIIGEALDIATPAKENSIDDPNDENDDDDINTAQKKVSIITENQYAIIFSLIVIHVSFCRDTPQHYVVYSSKKNRLPNFTPK